MVCANFCRLHGWSRSIGPQGYHGAQVRQRPPHTPTTHAVLLKGMSAIRRALRSICCVHLSKQRCRRQDEGDAYAHFMVLLIFICCTWCSM